MATVVTKFPTTNAAETSTGLVNPNNAHADDGVYSTGAPGKNLTLATKYGTFGFDAAIPSNAVITKVQIIEEHKVDTTGSVATCRTYTKVSGSAGTNHDDATEPAADTIRTYNVTAERAWTRANLLDGVFECVLAAVQGSSGTAVIMSFDYVKVEVTFTVPDLYWVGGTASWNGTAGSKWSPTSGGTASTVEPDSDTNVHFDANSGAVTVTVDTSDRACKSLDFTGFTGTFAGTGTRVAIYGALTLATSMTFSYSFVFDMSGTVGGNLDFKSLTISCSINISSGNSGTWTFLSDLTITAGTARSIDFASGTINTGGFNLTAPAFWFGNSGTTVVNLSSSTLTATGGSSAPWPPFATNSRFAADLTINAGTSTLKQTGAGPVGFNQFGNATFSYTFYNVWFACGVSTATIPILGSQTFNQLKDTGTGTHTMQFDNGKTTTVADWQVSGTSGHLITITSDTTATHTLTKTSGTVSADFLDISHSVAGGGAAWYAGANSTNSQATASAGSGWIFTPPPPFTSDWIPRTNLPAQMFEREGMVGY